MRHLILYENYVAEMSSEETKYWALFAHVADFFAKAHNMDELNTKFQKAKSISSWPNNVVDFFYKWYQKNHREYA